MSSMVEARGRSQVAEGTERGRNAPLLATAGGPVCEAIDGPSKGRVVPDAGCGVVIGVDISKGWIDWRACRPGQWEPRHHTPQSREGFESLERHLVARAQRGEEVWVGMEPTGSYGQCLQAWLQERGWPTVLVNPYHVARVREVTDNSPRKDDDKDPGVIAELIWRGSYYRPRALEGPYAELRVGIGEWYSLAKKRTAVRNEAHALVEGWFPEVKEVFRDALCLSVRALIRNYEAPEGVARAPLASVERALREGTCGRGGRYGARLQELAEESVALVTGQRSRVRELRGLLDQLALYERQRKVLQAELAEWVAQTREGKYLLSVPWVGVVVVGGLLGECGPLGDFLRAAALEKFVGLHLYRLASGKRQGPLHVAKRGRSGARYLLGQLAASHVREGGLCHTWAQECKARGMKPLQIQIAVARKLLRTFYALGKTEQYFDRERWNAGAQTADGVPPL